MMDDLNTGVAEHNKRTQDIIGRGRLVVERSTAEGRRKAQGAKIAAQIAGAPSDVLGLTPPPTPDADAEEAGVGGTPQKAQAARESQSPVPYGVKYVDGKPVTEWLLPDGSLTTNIAEADQAEFAARNVRLRHEFENRMKDNGLDVGNKDDVGRQTMIDAVNSGAEVDPQWRTELEEQMKGLGLDINNKEHVAWMLAGNERMILEHRLEDAEERLRGLNERKAKELENRFDFPLPPGAVRPGKSVTGQAQTELERDLEQTTAEVLVLHEALDRYDQNVSANGKGWGGKILQGLWDGITDPNTWTMGIADMSVNHTLRNSDYTTESGRRLIESNMLAEQHASTAPNPGGFYSGAYFAGELFGDPSNWFVTGLSTKAASLTSRLAAKGLAKATTKGMTKEVAGRMANNSLRNRMLIAGAGQAGFFGTFDGLRDMRQQVLDGGWTDNGYTDDKGVYHPGEFHEGFSPWHSVKAAGKGSAIGFGMGFFGAGFGNVANWGVRASHGAVGKTAARVGGKALGFEVESTVFATPEMIDYMTMDDAQFDYQFAESYGYAEEKDPEKREQARNAARKDLVVDAWTESQANLVGLKLAGKMTRDFQSIVLHPKTTVKKAIGNVASTLDKLRKTDERDHRTFRERVNNMFATTPFDIHLSKEDREELRRAGYDDSLFLKDDTEGQIGRKDAALDGYDMMARLMKDPDVPMEIRAKAYYIVTGHTLPKPVITGWRWESKDEGYVVEAISPNGVVSRRTYATKKAAKRAVDDIQRQAELNSIDMGERNKTQEVSTKAWQDACEDVAERRGGSWTAEGVRSSYEQAMRDLADPEKAEGVGQATRDMIKEVDEAAKYYAKAYERETPEAIRARLKKETGKDVDDILRIPKNKRTEEEQAILDEYSKELFPSENASEEVAREAGGAGAGPVSAGARTMREAREAGYNMTGPEDSERAWRNARYRLQRMYELFGNSRDPLDMLAEEFGTNDPAEILDRLGDSRFNAEERAAITEYLKAKETSQSITDRMREETEQAMRQEREFIAKTTHEDGQIRPATMKVENRQVYIVKGNVVLSEDGSMINTAASDRVIYVYNPATDRVEQTSPEMLAGLGAPTSADDTLIEMRNGMAGKLNARVGAMRGHKDTFNPGDTFEADIWGDGAARCRVTGIDEDGMVVFEVEGRKGQFGLDAHQLSAMIDNYKQESFEADMRRQEEEAARGAEERSVVKAGEGTPGAPETPAEAAGPGQKGTERGEISRNDNEGMEARSASASALEERQTIEYEPNDSFRVSVNGREGEMQHAAVVDREGDTITIWTPFPVTDKSEKSRTMAGYTTDISRAELDGIIARDSEGRPVGYVAANPEKIDDKIDSNGNTDKSDNGKEDIEPVGYGDFGPVFTQFRGDANGAIRKLTELRSGEAVGALHHKDVGEIDLVWGIEGTGHSDGMGLAKLVKFHPEVVEHLQEILDDMKVVKRTDNRINLESDTHKAAVRLTWNNEAKKWLLTAFEKKETPKSIDKTTDTGDNPTDLRGDTALSQNSGVSDDKVNDSASEKQADSTQNPEGKNKRQAEVELTPLQRIPRNERGEPVFEQAESPEAGWDALVEFSDGDAAAAKEIADIMAEKKRKAFEKAQKQKPKGEDPTEIRASRKTLNTELAQAEQEYNIWKQIAGVEQSRQDAIRAQQEAEARKAEEERLAQEKARAEKEAAEEAERKALKKVDKRFAEVYDKVKDSELAVERLHQMEPENIYEVAALALTGRKILWNDSRGSFGFKRESGHGEGERKKLFTMFASKEKGGRSLRKISEDEMMELCDMYGIRYDSSEAFDALMEVLRSANVPSDITNYIKNNRIEQAERIWEQEHAYEREQYAQWCQEAYGMSIEDYEAYEEHMAEVVRLAAENFDENEYYGNIADELKEREENERRRIQESESEREGSRDGGGGSLLPGQRIDTASGRVEDARGQGISERDGRAGADPSRQVSADTSGREVTARSTQFDRTVPANPEEQRSAIARIIDFAKRVKNRVERAVIAGITARQAKDFAEQGIKVDETWVHSFESSALSHNQKHHGNSQTEDARGQIAITPEDYSKIPEILEDYDRVTKSPNNTKGTDNEVIIYEKEFDDGYVYYLEEKRDNRKSLAFHTMYKKKKGTDSSDGFAVKSTAPITPITTSDNLDSYSERKVNVSASEKQADGGKSSLQHFDNKGEQSVKAAVETASAEVNTEPTEAQKKAGNYKMGHVTIGEFDITIETPAGSVRKGVDADGKEWSNTMANTYGYIKGTEGVDGDHIDVFLHSDMDQWNGRKVFVVDQTNTDGSFDEHKVMLGFNDKDEAMTAYLANYDKTWADTHPGLRISETNIEDFNKWVQASHRKTKPFADYSTVSKVVDDSPVKADNHQTSAEADARGQKGIVRGANYEELKKGLARFAGQYKDAVDARGIKAIESGIAEWLSGLTAEDLVDLDAQTLVDVCHAAGLDKGKAWAFRMSIDKATPKDLIDRVFELRNLRRRENDEARLSVGQESEQNREVYEVAKEMLESAGIEVIEVSDAEAREKLDSRIGDEKLMGSRTDRKMDKIAEHYAGKQLDENHQAAVDVFSGKRDNVTIEVERADGRKRVVMRQGKEPKAGAKHSLFRHFETSSNYITADDIALIPEIIAKGERVVNGNKISYEYITEDGSKLKVTTEVHGEKERFTNLFSNKKPQQQKRAENTQLSAPRSDVEVSDAKVDEKFQIGKPEKQESSSGLSQELEPIPQEREGKNDVRFLRRPDGVVYGWTQGGKVYLNRDAMNPESPLHEYTHLWDDMVRRENPVLWDRGVELMKQTSVWQEVLHDPNYADIRDDEDAVASEVHSRLTGRDGARLMEEMIGKARKEGVVETAKAVTLVERLKHWLGEMFKGLKKTLSKWSKRDLENLTVDDFNRMTIRDLAEGIDPRSGDKSLVAVHNLSEEKLRSALELGGFPMPSIAVTKAGTGHGEYGRISLVFGKESIDPSDRRNKVYSGDAWTPTFPQIGYKLNSGKTSEIYARANKALGMGLPLFRAVDFHPDNYERRINDRDRSLVEAFMNDYGAKQLFLFEKGNPVKEYEKREVDKYSPENVRLFEKILKAIGEDRLRNESIETIEPEIKRIISELTGKDVDSMKPLLAKTRVSNTIRKALDYAENGNKKTETDIEATQAEIDARIDSKEYEAWLEDMFAGVVEKSGIRNDMDLFTPSGKSRKWESLYDALTLDNVVRAMKRQAEKGGHGLFGGSIFGASTKELNDIGELRREAEERIKSLPKEEYDAERKRIEERLEKVSLPSVSRSFPDAMDFVENVREAVAKTQTAEGICRNLRKIYPDMTMDVAEEIADIVRDIQKMSTRYFEAKPQRAVGFEEVRLAVVPEGTPEDIVRELEKRGIPVKMYKSGDERQRSSIISRETSEMGIRFHAAMARGREDFDRRRERAVAERGIVMPGLNQKEVRVVDVPRHDFTGTGKEALKAAEKWAKENIVGIHQATDSRGDKFDYSISNDAVEKYVSRSATDKSENIGVHLAALKKLTDIISESIEVEVHPDYMKLDGIRKYDNKINPESLVHRFFGAVNIEGKMYRIKTTMREYQDANRSPLAHSYQITQIELLEAPSDGVVSNSGEPLAMTSNSSIDGASPSQIERVRIAKLLKGVEKSYDPGKKLLDESEKDLEYRTPDEGIEYANARAIQAWAAPLDNLRFRRDEQGISLTGRERERLRELAAQERAWEEKWKAEHTDTDLPTGRRSRFDFYAGQYGQGGMWVDMRQAEREAGPLRDADGRLISANARDMARRALPIIMRRRADLLAERPSYSRAGQAAIDEELADLEYMALYYQRMEAGEDVARTMPGRLEHQRMLAAARDVAAALGEKVVLYEAPSDIVDSDYGRQTRKRRSYGWYNPNDGTIHINVGRHKDAQEIVKTALHEIIGHKTIEQIMGPKRFARLIEEIWNHAGRKVRAKIAAKMGKNGWDFREATKEYLGELAEEVHTKGFEHLEAEKKTLWQRMKAKIQDFLNRILEGMKIPARIRLTENDLSYMMWKLYKHKERKAAGKSEEGDIFDKAEEIVRREQWETKGDGLEIVARGENTLSKRERIEKLRNSKSAVISGNEIEISDNLAQTRKNAVEYGKTLQGEYVNDDTGNTIQLQRGRRNGGIKELLQHDMYDEEHIQSIAALPQIIEKGIYIDSTPNNDRAKNSTIDEYQHYVCGLKIGNEDYTVHSIVAVDINGQRYYDHKLSHIEKGKLLDFIEAKQSKEQILAPLPSAQPKDGSPLTIRSERKINELISLLQVDDEIDTEMLYTSPEPEYRPRQKPAPRKTVKVYKLVRVKEGRPGEWFPLFIDSASPLRLGEWLDADSPDLSMLRGREPGQYIVDPQTKEVMTREEFYGEHPELRSMSRGRDTKYPSVEAINYATENGLRWMEIEETDRSQRRFGGENRRYWNLGINGSGAVSTFSLRPGWHAGSLPTMRQIGKGKNKDLRDDNFVWVEGEVSADIDYQAEAERNPDKDLPDRIPEDGYYMKATNANKTTSQADRVGWYVAGSFKANRFLSDAEARKIIDDFNAAHPDMEPVAYDYERESGRTYDPEAGLHFRDGEEEGESLRDMTIEERTLKMAMMLADRHAEDIAVRDAAAEALGKTLGNIRKAMAAQYTYDFNTVRSLSTVADLLISSGTFLPEGPGEVKRLYSIMKRGIGHAYTDKNGVEHVAQTKKDFQNAVDSLMDLFVSNQLKLSEKFLDEVMKIRGSKVNARGVEVMGDLDAEGQIMVRGMKEYMKTDARTIRDRIDALGEIIATRNDAASMNAAAEKMGLEMAEQYVEEVSDRSAQEKMMRGQLDDMSKQWNASMSGDERKAYIEQKRALEESIRKIRIERAEAMRQLASQIGNELRNSIERVKAFREREKQRVEEIRHNANSDMQGRPHYEHGKKKSKLNKIANAAAATILAPLATFEQYCRLFGKKSVDGRGYIFERFVVGMQKCRDNEWTDLQRIEGLLNEKAAKMLDKKKANWVALNSLARKTAGIVKWHDGGEMREHTLTQGNIMYIYMVDKMTDGRVKLRAMGIDSDKVAELTKILDPKLREIADWIQDEFLPAFRDEINEVHMRMFGAPMADIEYYFPLKILGNAREETEDMSRYEEGDELPKTMTGAIIKRRFNIYDLDILNANPIDMTIDHVRELLEWKNMAEYRRDLGTLLSYKRFRNQVKNMRTVYGAGEANWRRFKKLALLVGGAYKPQTGSFDRAMVNLTKLATCACITMNLNSAAKQLLSYPAFTSEANALRLLYNLAPWRMKKCWKWAMENMPAFQRRWMSRQAGNDVLKEWDGDWDWTKKEFAQKLQRMGIAPNAFIDGLTVAMGSEAVYHSKYKEYIKDGYSKEMAHEKAIIDAEVIFNLSQQSSEAMYISLLQNDRSMISLAFTNFRNSSMAYARQQIQALREIENLIMHRKEQIEFETKKAIREGLTEDQARQKAKRKYNKQWGRSITALAQFSTILPALWKFGILGAWYAIFGDDEDEKKDDAETSIKRGLEFGWMEGFAGGGTIPDVLYSLLEGESINIEEQTSPASASFFDFVNALGDGKTDKAINEGVNLAISIGFGVKPQYVEDVIAAGMDFFEQDEKARRDYEFLIMRIIHVPQSQLDRIYFDELGMNAREATGKSPAELAERYATYKARRANFATMWKYDDERWETEVKEPWRKRFEKEAKERLKGQSEDRINESLEKYDAEWSQTGRNLRELAKKPSYLVDKAAEAQAIFESPEGTRYRLYNDMHPFLNQMIKSWLKAPTAEEAATEAKAIMEYKAKVVEMLDSWDNPSKSRAAGREAMRIASEWHDRQKQRI